MTKKLSELFNLPEITEDFSNPSDNESGEALLTIQENQNIIKEVDDALDKIDIALPTVKDLDTSDQELDELADLAKSKFEDLMDLGMNMDPRFGGVVFQTAGTLLGHAITAKTAKMDKRLKMIQLQIQKARLDQQSLKNKDTTETPINGQGVILDRNALLEQILQKSKT